jgi:hypothetical protein
LPGVTNNQNLLDEADEARLLASGTQDETSVQDLLEYADALEAEAARLDKLWIRESNAEIAGERFWNPVLVSHI